MHLAISLSKISDTLVSRLTFILMKENINYVNLALRSYSFFSFLHLPRGTNNKEKNYNVTLISKDFSYTGKTVLLPWLPASRAPHEWTWSNCTSDSSSGLYLCPLWYSPSKADHLLGHGDTECWTGTNRKTSFSQKGPKVQKRKLISFNFSLFVSHHLL